jgi:hypothetical protein
VAVSLGRDSAVAEEIVLAHRQRWYAAREGRRVPTGRSRPRPAPARPVSARGRAGRSHG